MSTIIAVDPNVLHAALKNDANSRYAISLLNEYKERFCLGLDPDHEIFEAYYSLGADFTSTELLKPFIKNFLQRSGAHRKHVPIKSAKLNSKQQAFLNAHNCNTPVEPQLISVGYHAPDDRCVLVLGEVKELPGLQLRGTNDPETIEELQREFNPIEIWGVKEFEHKVYQTSASRYPATEKQFNIWLQDCEGEFVEFKQPCDQDRNYVSYLTSSIIRKALEATCAMVNGSGGHVIVGVTPDRTVLGIELDQNCPDDDVLSRRFTDEYRRFKPSVNKYVKPAIIRLENGKRVIILHVYQGQAGIRYTFNGIEWDRNGPSTRKTDVKRPGSDQI